jgi:undecaprenyl-diphosphatase
MAGLLAWRREWRKLAVWIIFFAGCVALVYSLKHLFDRVQPLNMQDLPRGSFPSGHTLLATSVYGMIVYLAWDMLAPRWRPWLVAMAPLLLASTVTGLLLPGYHFISDVLGGYTLGVIWMLCCVAILRAKGRRSQAS